MELQTADARYEKTWHQYLRELGHHPTLRLAAYLRLKHVNEEGFRKWMHRNSYSVHAVKEHLLCLRMEASASDAAGQCSFLPVSLTERPADVSQGADMLTGISLTLPDGTVIGIRRGSASAVVSFLKLYTREGASCSD